MSAGPMAATRSNVVRVRRRLVQVTKGAALLKKKREALVAELLHRARPAVDGRRAIERQAVAAWKALLAGLAAAGGAPMEALGWPTREVRVELETVEVWGVRAAQLAAVPSLVRSLAARGAAPGSLDGAPLAAAAELERLVELLLTQAPSEQLMRRLGQALARVTRLVNTLEQRVATSLERDLSQMRRTLDEREREERLRLARLVSKRATR